MADSIDQTTKPETDSLLQKFVISAFAMNLAFTLGQLVPSKMGYALAGSLARRVASRRDSSIVKAVRLNQSVVRHTTSPDKLDRCVEQVFNPRGTFCSISFIICADRSGCCISFTSLRNSAP